MLNSIQTPLRALPAVSVVPGPVLEVITGGLNQPGTVTVDRAVFDELSIEIAVLHKEARQMCAAALPLARRLAIATQFLGPESHQTAAALVHRLERFEARNAEHSPDAA